jgi:hypothetical protein
MTYGPINDNGIMTARHSDALDIHGSVDQDQMTNKMQQCRIIYCSLAALHFSSDIFSHHQEHLNCIYSLWYYTV